MAAGNIVHDWVSAHVAVEPPSAVAVEAVRDALALVPEPEEVAAITPADGRPRIAALAGGALYVLWATPPGMGAPEAARCRRVPLDPGATAVEFSARGDIRHWSFELDDEPLVFQAAEEAQDRFARALAAALGWQL
jgi:hypothetical protein